MKNKKSEEEIVIDKDKLSDLFLFGCYIIDEKGNRVNPEDVLIKRKGKQND